MYCSTCGALIPAGRTACDTCGTPAARPPRPPRPPARAPEEGWMIGRAEGQCPRCGFHGDGLPYFSRGSHVAALVGATVLTAGAMGAGGLVYYVARRDHRVCPRCGRSWGRQGERAVLRAPAPGRPARSAEEAPLPASREAALRGWSVALFVMAVVLLIPGIVELEFVPILLGLLAGGGGALLHQMAQEARQERRAALLARLQLPVLKLATRKGGQLTVTETAAELGWTLPRAEKVLRSLDDGVRVDSEVTDEGVIVYHFLELRLPPPDPQLGPYIPPA